VNGQMIILGWILMFGLTFGVRVKVWY